MVLAQLQEKGGVCESVQGNKTMNDLREPPQLVKVCTTRWLVWFPAVKRILEQWIELRALFRLMASEKDYTARQLHLMYQDQANFLYLTFLKPVLSDLYDVNLPFQATKADVTKLYKDLRTLIFSLVARVLSPQAIKQSANQGVLRRREVQMLSEALTNPENHLHCDRTDLGSSFNTLVNSPNLDLSSASINIVREKCTKFLITLREQLLDKMPENISTIEQLRYLAPELVMASVGRPRFEQLPLDLMASGINVDILESQWRFLGTHKLTEISPDFHNVATTDTITFWGEVRLLTNAIGKFPYKELADFAIKCLTLPVSNAVVERVFSIMNAVKTQARNKMQLELLQSIIRIRVHLKGTLKSCCRDFKPSKAMITLFSKQMYFSMQEGKPLATAEPEAEDFSAEDLLETVRLLADDDLVEQSCSIPGCS